MEKQLSFFEQFGLAFKSYGTALSIVFKNNLWLYIIYPIAISLLLFAAEFYFLNELYNSFKNNLFWKLNNDYKHVWTIVNYILKTGFFIVFFLIDYLFWKYIVLIFMSPIMAILSERTETILTGKIYPFTFKQLMRDIIRGIGIAFRNMFFQGVILLLVFVVIWIPVIGWICPIFLLIISYYFYGFSMLDFISERRRLSVSESIRFVRKNKGLAIGNGFVFTLLFAIPFVGVVLSTVLSPIAACVSVLEKEGKI